MNKLKNNFDTREISQAVKVTQGASHSIPKTSSIPKTHVKIQMFWPTAIIPVLSNMR